MGYIPTPRESNEGAGGMPGTGCGRVEEVGSVGALVGVAIVAVRITEPGCGYTKCCICGWLGRTDACIGSCDDCAVVVVVVAVGVWVGENAFRCSFCSESVKSVTISSSSTSTSTSISTSSSISSSSSSFL